MMKYVALMLALMLLLGLFVAPLFGISKGEVYNMPFHLLNIIKPVVDGCVGVFRFAVDPEYRSEVVTNAWDGFLDLIGIGGSSDLEPAITGAVGGGVGDLVTEPTP